MTDYNLSDEIVDGAQCHDIDIIFAEDVRKFIKRLKAQLFWENEDLIAGNMYIIDKLAGSALIGEKSCSVNTACAKVEE